MGHRQRARLWLRVGRRKRTFIVQYRNARGQSRRLKLGTWPMLSLAEARAKAAGTLAAVARGEDPAAERQQARQSVPTLAAFAERYRAAGYPMRNGEPKRPNTAAMEGSILSLYLEPAFGALALDAISEADLRRLHASLRDKHSIANRMLLLLRHLLHLAADWGELPKRHPDPTAEVRPCREVPRSLDRCRLGSRVAPPRQADRGDPDRRRRISTEPGSSTSSCHRTD